MSIRNLKTLIAVAEHRSFTAAAAAVHVTHAAVSHQMKALEEDWGVELFDRSTRTPTLTPIGRALVARARDVVNSYEGMIESVANEGGFKGEVSIGAVQTTISGMIPRVLRLLKDEHPDLHIRVVPGLTIELIAQVERGALDAAVITRPPVIPRKHSWREISVEQMELLASSDAEGNDAIELLKSSPYIRFTRKAVVGEMIETWLQNQDFEVNDSMELETLDAIASLVHENLGVSIVPRLSVAPITLYTLKRLPIDPPPPYRTLGLISRDDNIKPRVLDAVYEKARLVVETNAAESRRLQKE